MRQENTQAGRYKCRQGYNKTRPAEALRVQRDTFTGALVQFVQAGMASSQIDPHIGRMVLDLIAGNMTPRSSDVAQEMVRRLHCLRMPAQQSACTACGRLRWSVTDVT
eukprot:362306-Chlamydomonas_euryale.AAC.8